MKKTCDGYHLDLDKKLLLLKLTEICRQELKGCEVFDEIDSTNQYLLTQKYGKNDLPRVCFAGRQTQGRGRRGRAWQSFSRHNIYMSLAYQLKLPRQVISNLGLLIGVAVCRVLKLIGINAAIKWPNDVMVDGKKIAGILIESKIKVDQQILVVIGIGLNVNMSGFVQGIKQPWTDVCNELPEGVDVNRSELAGMLLLELMKMMSEYKQKGFEPFKAEFASLDLCYQCILTVQTEGECIKAKGIGVDEQGCLCVDINGELHRFYAADVSIRVPNVIN